MCHAPPEFKSAVSKNVYFAEAVGSMTGGQDKVRHILHTLQHILHFFAPSLPLYLFILFFTHAPSPAWHLRVRVDL